VSREPSALSLCGDLHIRTLHVHGETARGLFVTGPSYFLSLSGPSSLSWEPSPCLQVESPGLPVGMGKPNPSCAS
jgi:hypothetical protein